MGAQVAIACADLETAIAFYEGLGLRLDMIMPADAPRLAAMSGYGIALRLEVEAASAESAPVAAGAYGHEFLIVRASDAWGIGRAGMQYRDLIPGRLGGRVIASLIRIAGGGPVADYVHHHRVRFQMIYCRRGWVRVVYEDQGPAFVMQAGDCVLQPPGIRHRVLESSPALEVIEVSAPAGHETYRDHALELPTAAVRSERLFAGQRFVRHVAAEAAWRRDASGAFDIRAGERGRRQRAGLARAIRGDCDGGGSAPSRRRIAFPHRSRRPASRAMPDFRRARAQPRRRLRHSPGRRIHARRRRTLRGARSGDAARAPQHSSRP